MVTKTVHIKDPLTGTDRDVTCHFHLTKGEMSELQLATEGGLVPILEQVVAEKNAPALVEFFRLILLKSYGVRTQEGEFWKNRQKTEIFACSEAYSEVLCWLLQAGEETKKFFEAMMSPGLVAFN